MKKKELVILTGSSGLLGSSIKKKLIENGYLVLGIDIKKDKFKHNDYLFFKCDISKENQVKRLYNFLIEKKINATCLINNAAIDHKFDPKNNFNFSNYSLKDWRKVMSINVDGVFLISKYICKIFEKKNRGNLINISSTYGLVGPDNTLYKNIGTFKKRIDYPTSKSAIIGFTKSLASYYANKNIRVNCICPGGIRNNQDNKFIKAYSKKTIIGRLAEADEISEAINFLVSKSSSYMTGSTLVVDGGWTTI